MFSEMILAGNSSCVPLFFGAMNKQYNPTVRVNRNLGPQPVALRPEVALGELNRDWSAWRGIAARLTQNDLAATSIRVAIDGGAMAGTAKPELLPASRLEGRSIS